jgi:hypothetical protein
MVDISTLKVIKLAARRAAVKLEYQACGDPLITASHLALNSFVAELIQLISAAEAAEAAMVIRRRAVDRRAARGIK